MTAHTETTDRYIAVNRKSVEVGCGSRFTELRTYILDTETGKLVRDVGHAKYSAETAASLARSMNDRNSAGASE